MAVHSVLLAGAWRPSAGTRTFRAVDPQTGQPWLDEFPVSPWAEIERAIEAAAEAARVTRGWPGERFARFLDAYAELMDASASELADAAHRETALPIEPRLLKAELPRTTNQLRQAGVAAREGSWTTATIDTAANIRSYLAPIGPVVVFGPNNFPFAFNSMAGGDFASAVAAGNPVIAKGHSSHPGVTRLLALLAHEAAQATDMPAGFVQLIYRTEHADGERLVSHPLVGATGYTGSRETGLVLKAAADRVGKPFYAELSSINPVFMLPGALAERTPQIVDEFVTSCLMGTGQFCTNPGLVIVPAGPRGDQFVEMVRERFAAAPVGTLLSENVRQHLERSLRVLQEHGAQLLTGGQPGGGRGYCLGNTLLKTDGDTFFARQELQTEAFGNVSLLVAARDLEQMVKIAERLEGNLTGTIYSARDGSDDDAYDSIAPALRTRVGRLLNDKMPTGVAVSPAMNHGGPFPATGHPGFTAVGIPAAMHRFAMLQCFDGVRPARLPVALQNKNPTGQMWRLIDRLWTRSDVTG